MLLLITDPLSAYNDLQLATGAYYFAALAGLTVLAGSSGQISLGHGALMAVGAYTVALLIGNEGWALFPALAASVVVTRCWSGFRSAPPRAGCAGRTWPARRSRSRSACRRWRTSSRRRSAARTGW